MRKTFNFQLFTETGNSNNNVRTYQQQFAGLLSAVYGYESYFNDFLPLQTLDGVKNSAIAFTVKNCNTAVTMGAYDKGANVAFGTGTGSTSRFGQRVEIKYTDVDVPYNWEWAYHEGIDRHTVNAEFDQVVAERLDDEAQAKVALFNAKQSAYISKNAGKTIAATAASLDSLTDKELIAIFDQLSTYFTNIKVKKNLRKIAKVHPVIFNAIINSGLATTSKGSAVNIDANSILRFKGFEIQELPEDAFQTGEYIYASVAGVGVAYTGIVTARAIESEDFDGTALQGAGKAGEYITKDNLKAVAKVTLTKGA